jgi:hypothetical protein
MALLNVAIAFTTSGPQTNVRYYHKFGQISADKLVYVYVKIEG